VAGSGSQNHLVYNGFCFFRMFFQIIVQHFTYSLVDSTHHFVVSQLGFSLSFKLRFSNFYRDHGCKSFTEVITGDFYFDLFQHFAVFCILFQCTGQGTAETCQMRTAFYCIDIIDIRVDVLRESGIIHDSYLDGDVLLLRVQIDHIVNQVFA
jgi:hypothetical protein